jgi:opacity protein-like surface antigen
MNKRLYLLIVVFALCGSGNVFAQVAAWGGGADYNDYSFGFYFSYITSSYKILKKPDWRAPYADATGKTYTDSLNSVASSPSDGFGIGFIYRYRITDNFEVRTTPALVFADRSITYQFATASQNKVQTISAALMEFPLSLKVKSDRMGDFRAYLIGGVKYSYGLSGPKPDDPTESPINKPVQNVRGFSSYEVGVGCDIYFNYFKFSPELKISNSFHNILVAANDPYNKPLDQLFLHTLSFSIYFE